MKARQSNTYRAVRRNQWKREKRIWQSGCIYLCHGQKLLKPYLGYFNLLIHESFTH